MVMSDSYNSLGEKHPKQKGLWSETQNQAGRKSRTVVIPFIYFHCGPDCRADNYVDCCFFLSHDTVMHLTDL